ncbi:MotA/TolQ/ExbB proton channel family protein [Inhella gelatinilytica]|uniref:Biopolymer transport protein ExbB n=1 Tax=Inhella gelatinilytica TaxID=2795030 RepID=A0A931NC91_9BURK|nr:MotA/TolQ/ExbB proton channel family protein [Inhella gelatinilytica]MBH9551732.1 MotA/TolQ/ExbB proton channel family protein [Inhella gelatinilytica]
MPDFIHVWSATDVIGRTVALLLLAMSVLSWSLIFWRSLTLWRAQSGLPPALAAFWAAPTWEQGSTQAAQLDREGLLAPLLQASTAPQVQGSLAEQGPVDARLTRQLRDALHLSLRRLSFGQVALASIGATAPFVGLFGTVWGIYQALLDLGGGGALSMDRIAGPVGEALVMTAAGLAVAIPAVLAYNIFGKRVAALEAELEGFAHDLREWQAARAAR